MPTEEHKIVKQLSNVSSKKKRKSKKSKGPTEFDKLIAEA